MARHCSEAALREQKATAYLLKAGQQAIARGTMAEAATAPEGSRPLSSLPDSTAKSEQELNLQIELGHALRCNLDITPRSLAEHYLPALVSFVRSWVGPSAIRPGPPVNWCPLRTW